MSAQTAAQRIAEKAAKLAGPKTTPEAAAAEQQKAADAEAALAPATGQVHTKPVRSTVDLSPVDHAELKKWLGETAVMVGKSRVTTQDVMRVMVKRLLTDETLARKIRDDLMK